MSTSPKRSIDLLDELERLGFHDGAFALLHHFRLADRKPTIAAHRRYCAQRDSFNADGENELVQRRLELVLNAYRKAGFASRHPKVFEALADATYYELRPIRASRVEGVKSA